MLRRPSLSCREFRNHHVEYVDGLLSGEIRQLCDAHRSECPPCAARDVQIRRALLTLQVLPEIAPSADFRARLNARLAAEASHPLTFPTAFHEPRRLHARWWVVGTALAASAALLLFAPGRPTPASPGSAPAIVQATVAPTPTTSVTSATATVSTGPRVRARGETARATPRFEALSSTVPLGSAPQPLHHSNVRLQTVTYIGQ